VVSAPAGLWAELDALWRPRPRLGGAEWAERERVLGADESPLPGPWRSVPWQREILDALADVSVSDLLILKGTQVGASEVIRCAIGRWALHDPGDVLWVMTTEHAARRAMKKLQAMFTNTPTLRPLVSERKRDTALLEMVLATGMRIVIGWAGSAQSLSSDPFRYVVFDEVAKYVWDVQGEGSPTALGRDRTKAHGLRGKRVYVSSPKSEGDPIVTGWRETSDRRVFAAPCPSCGLAQPFEWCRVRWRAGGSVVGPDEAPQDPERRVEQAEELERTRAAWLACEEPGCSGQIEPSAAQSQPGARWQPEAEAVEPGRRRAYHVPEAWHWATTTADLAAKFLRSIHPKDRHVFFTGALGMPEASAESRIEVSLIEGRALWARGVVPAWASVVVATADTQMAGWWHMVRAWGPGGRSRLLDWGFVETEAELLARALDATYPIEGKHEAERAPIMRLGIDTGGGMETPDGSRTQQVYRLIQRNPRVLGLKGEGDRAANEGQPWRESKSGAVTLYLLNRSYYADLAASLIRARPVLWEECVGAEDPAYARQLASEHVVTETTARGTRRVWRKRNSRSANHLWDCARYQVFLSEHVRAEDRRMPAWTARPSVRRAEERARDEGRRPWKIGR
jgi:phage terminase large subunit GpA-like protein